MEIIGQSTKATTQHPYVHLGYLAASNSLNLMLPIGGLFFLIGILQIAKRKKRYLLASIASIVVGIFFIIIPLITPNTHNERFKRIMSQSNLHSIYIALEVYANDYESALPVENWCDILVTKMDVPPGAFGTWHSEMEVGESAYALNENIVSMKLFEIPADVVLLFETELGVDEERTESVLSRQFAQESEFPEDFRVFKNRWNQVGDAKDITTEYHNGEGACVLFGDGHPEFVKTEDIAKLKWHPEESEMPLEISQ